MRAQNYEVMCMMCGTQVGLIIQGSFTAHSGCRKAPPRRAGMFRCCNCGGSLYLEPLEGPVPAPITKELRRLLSAGAA